MRHHDDSAPEDAFSGLAATSIHLHPDDIPAAAATAARKLGLDDLRIYLVDLEQRVLRPFTGSADPADEPEEIAVDGTLAGRAYRSERPIAGEPDGGRTSVWLPLLDSAERPGAVTATTTAAVDDRLLGRFSTSPRWSVSSSPTRAPTATASPAGAAPGRCRCRPSCAGRCSLRSPSAAAT